MLACYISPQTLTLLQTLVVRKASCKSSLVACTILVVNHAASGPSHHTTQSNKSPIPPAVYIYSGRASSSVIHTETRFRKWTSYHIHLSPAPQVTHADDAVTFEYVPAQHRHASVDRHEPVRVAVLHQLPSAASRHARMLHLSSAPPFVVHSSSPVRHL
jgi:hypothetical protein